MTKQTTRDILEEAESLRRCVREMASLSALASEWSRSEPREIADSLADVLCRALPVAFVHVRLRGQGGTAAVEVVRTPQGPAPAHQIHEIGQQLEPLLIRGNSDQTAVIANPFGRGTLRLTVSPIGSGGDCGDLVAAWHEPDFPGPTELLLLGAAANQATAALQHRQIEKALRRSEWELADFFENATVGLHWIGPDGTVLRVNRAELDLLGYSHDEYVGRHIAEFHADQYVIDDILRRLQAGEDLLDYESRMRCKDGSIKYVLINSNALWEDGQFIHTRCFTRDITDRKRVEEALRRQSSQYATLVEHIPDIVARLDRDLRFLYIGPAVSTVTGRPPGEYIGKPRTNEGLAPEFAEARENLSRKVFDTGQEQLLEFPIQTPEGERLLECRFIPEFAPDGSVETLMTLTRDVTERKLAERALRESEERYRSLTKAITSVVWTCDARGRFATPQPSWSAYTGQTWDELRGVGWARALHPEDREKVWRLWRAACRSKKRYHAEGRFWHAASHSYRHFEAHGVPIRNEDGSVREWVGTCLDVEDRKRAEEKLRLLWEAAAVLLTADDPDTMLRSLFAKISPHLGVDVYFNYMLNDNNDALRLASCEGIPAETAQTISHLEFGQAVCGTVAVLRKPIVATHIQESDDDKVQLVKSLGIRAYACNPLLAENRLLGTLSFASRMKDRFDPSEIAFLETICQYVTVAYERLRLLNELKEADRRKDEFLATLAHELRNPLAPIRNAVRVLRVKGPQQPDLLWSRDVIDRQVAHLTRLIEDLLDISRITRNKLELRKERVELADAVRDAVEASQPLIEQCGHDLTIAQPPEPIHLHADLVRLSQVLTNLLTNAAKYTDQGGRIWLTVERRGHEVVVRVRDTGVGISAEKLPHLFEIFFQADRSLERSQAGLGIGLSLVRRLVELHGGSVTAHSAGRGKGSEFTVLLPALAEPPRPTQPNEPAENISKKATVARRILVVDDLKDNADSLALLLRITGNEVVTAYDGEAAFEAAERFRPDVVLLDIMMPKVNGYDTCRRIREQPWGKGMMLIALTGWSQEEDLRRTREAGFDSHLVKPVDPATLGKLIEDSAADYTKR